MGKHPNGSDLRSRNNTGILKALCLQNEMTAARETWGCFSRCLLWVPAICVHLRACVCVCVCVCRWKGGWGTDLKLQVWVWALIQHATFRLVLLKQDPSSAGPSREVISPIPAAKGNVLCFLYSKWKMLNRNFQKHFCLEKGKGRSRKLENIHEISPKSLPILIISWQAVYQQTHNSSLFRAFWCQHC